MNDDLKNILQNLNNEIEQEKLLQYIDGKLPEQEMQKLEQQLRDDPFLADAMDGLKNISSKEKASLLAFQINKSLKGKLQKAKRNRVKSLFSNEYIVYTTIGILLIISIISYLIIKKIVG